MNPLSTLYRWYGRWNVVIALALIVLLVVAGIIIKSASNGEPEIAEELLPTVAVAEINSLSDSSPTTLIGSVEAVNEAEVETESAGRVVSVNAELGDMVEAGQILVRLESSAEAAAVLQAEGAYEAAQAAAAQSDTSVTQAQTNLDTANNNVQASRDSIVDLYRDSYTATNNIVINTLDDFFSDPFGQFLESESVKSQIQLL